ncbi:MAG TPA: 16S rRNA (cytosine(1402)-N(4))-methyltransferase [candidate division WWE3 bacterium]|uniref:Ribosomal RNA small subunit methyltransferase H n=1 Tax=candidate division WWE3 bacterium TaxID=2053526 RepID=A0A7V5J0J2_UNCKA|nr:16S rRNA (cytosine(1402)-N(4))-methyltransferase [candidate division WWE3 bacterium]
MEHIPVLLNEVVTSFKGIKGKWIVDSTLGRGGHFFELLKTHNLLVGIDADIESINFVKKELEKKNFEHKDSLYIKNNKKVLLIKGNFADLDALLLSYGIKGKDVGGILADLGISMHQIKSSGRGFSFLRPEEPLDMRIDTQAHKYTASDLLSFLSKKELASLFKNLADVEKASILAERIVNYRKKKRIRTVGDFLKALKMPQKKPLGLKRHPATKIFMALRIAVNKEHLNLESFLYKAGSFVKEGTILDVITFHSLEEETVKRIVEKLGFRFKTYAPSPEELLKNKSARSAKLFVIKK